jgi:hypothetical protein
LGAVIRRVLGLLIVGAIAVAVLRVFPWEDPNAFWQRLSELADQFRDFVGGLVEKVPVEELPEPAPIELPDPSTAGQ